MYHLAEELVRDFADIPVLSLGKVEDTDVELLAIHGGGHVGDSFKDLLGLGLPLLAREQGMLRQGQRLADVTGGSYGVGLARGGSLLHHPVTLISDPNLPPITKTMIEALGAHLIIVERPHPTLGWDRARADALAKLLQDDPDIYFTAQNHSPLNPETYRRWLVPSLAQKIDPGEITASVFAIGSGGHFSALSGWLKQQNPTVKTFAATRPGCIIFGGTPGPSPIRGVGNANSVPQVIAAHRHLVDGVEYVEPGEAFRACWKLAAHGIFVGGSSGLVYIAACRIARQIRRGTVLTFFPDRFGIYADTIGNAQWMRENGYWEE